MMLRDTDAGELSRILDENGWTAGVDPALAFAGIASGRKAAKPGSWSRKDLLRG